MSDESQAEVGPFQPYVSKAEGPGSGPDWSGTYPQASLRRIRASASTEEAIAQAATEAVVLLHSIRRILVWTAVIIPLIAVGLWITMVVVANSAEPERCTSIYSCR